MNELGRSNELDGDDLAILSLDPIITPVATIVATMQPAVNVALWQNHVPVLTELSLRVNATETVRDVTIGLTCEPAVIGPRAQI